jgi:hypothetical protein
MFLKKAKALSPVGAGFEGLRPILSIFAAP